MVILLSAFLYKVYFLGDKKVNIKVSDTKSKAYIDYTKNALDSTPDLKSATDLISQNRYLEARPILEKVISQSKDSGTKSIADLSLASSYFSDRQIATATKELVRVSEDVTYPKSTRAFALTSILQQYNGTKNPELLDVFGKVTEANQSDLLEIAHRKIVNLYPMGLSVSYLARADIGRSSALEEKKRIYDDAILKIDNDIAFQNKGLGSNYIVPNTIMAKGKLMAYAETFGLATSSEVIAAYRQAITVSKEKIRPTSAQFSILNYINYLGLSQKNNNLDLIEEALIILEKESLTEMILNNLSRNNAKEDWIGINNIVKTNEKYKKFFNQFGW